MIYSDKYTDTFDGPDEMTRSSILHGNNKQTWLKREQKWSTLLGAIILVWIIREHLKVDYNIKINSENTCKFWRIHYSNGSSSKRVYYPKQRPFTFWRTIDKLTKKSFKNSKLFEKGCFYRC